jgi:hypothetical protein
VVGITTALHYRLKVQDDLARLQASPADSSSAINAATFTYHLHEWLWAKVLKPQRPVTVRGTAIGSKRDWLQWLDANCPHFSLMQDLANGTKHANPVSSEVVEGFGAGPFGIGPWGAPYLLIDLGANAPNRYLVGSEVIEAAGSFMTTLSQELGA